MCYEVTQFQKGLRERSITTYVGPTFTAICCNELILIPRDKVEMGLTKEPSKLPFREDDNLPMAKELDEENGSLESNKLHVGRTLV
jgi:hypothetical protein